jgi:ecdysteroid kinase
MTAESSLPTASVEHLSHALRRSGVLGDARIARVEVEREHTTILSRIVRLRLVYEGAAGAPNALLLKTAHPDRPAGKGGRHEVAFYADVAAATAAQVVPRCFEAAWDEPTKTWHLLLEDLSATHSAASTWPLPPGPADCQRIVDAWARFHAAWWDDPRLGVSVGAWNDEPEADLQRFARQLAVFADRHGDRLPTHRRDLYDRLLAAAPRLAARYRTHRHLTIIHGDAHFWNCLVPRDQASGDVRLFDWDCWRIDTATDDLAYMMAMHWYPDRRQRLERPLLDRYHDALLAGGVRGYDRNALAEDYRLSVLWLITWPVWQEANNIPPVIWWNNLERILLAVDDLGCRDLLD